MSDEPTDFDWAAACWGGRRLRAVGALGSGARGQAGEAVRARARRALTERFSNHVDRGGVRLDATVHIVSVGRR